MGRDMGRHGYMRRWTKWLGSCFCYRWGLAFVFLLQFSYEFGFWTPALQTNWVHVCHNPHIPFHNMLIFQQKKYKWHQRGSISNQYPPCASESKPLCDPSSPGVEFLPLLLVLHELLLHLFHRTLCWRLVLFRKDVWEGECLALCLKSRNKINWIFAFHLRTVAF